MSQQRNETLVDSIARLIPEEQRVHFFERMAYLRHLSPDDDVLQIVEAMGFLALIIRQTPEAMAQERRSLEAALTAAVGEVKAATYGLFDAKELAAMLAESVRQQVAQTSLGAAAEDIHLHIDELRMAADELAAVVQKLTQPERGAVVALTRALGGLDAAADHIRAMIHVLALDTKRAVFSLCAASMALGFALGWYFHR